MPTIVEVLRGLPFFAEVREEVLVRLAGRCVPRNVDADFTLFRAGDRSAGLYLVLEGQVRIFRSSPDGREQTLAVEGPGRPVAELPLFDGGPYPAHATTVTPTRLAFLPREEFEYAFRTDPDVAAAIVRALGTRLRHLVQLVETVAFRDVAARLAMCLADYAEREGRAEGAHVVLDLARTQEQLAMEIGTARESVSRAFRQLSAQGMLVSRRGMRLVLAPPAMLRDWARGGGAPAARDAAPPAPTVQERAPAPPPEDLPPLDLRALPPPRPLLAILERVEQDGDDFDALVPFYPSPLPDLLRPFGRRLRLIADTPQGVRIRIERGEPSG